jgi:1-acyl-sn-glycerol-3-phosphate acyltransferase
MADTEEPVSAAPAPVTLRRKYWAAHPARGLARWALFYHRVVVEGGEHLPRQGTALILPKHRAYRDILVEGVALYELTRRYATFVMKVGLYGVLEMMGGVKVIRPKDIRRLRGRQERREHIRQARRYNQITLDYLSWLYEQGELVISHPEGMRYQDAMGPLQKEVIEHLLEVEQARGLRVPIIPVGLEYESFRRPRSRVWMRVGAPLYADQFADRQEIMAVLEHRLRTLSGLG